MKYYVLSIWSDVEPMPLDGPFKKAHERDKKARELKLEDINTDLLDGGGIYRLNVAVDGTPTVQSYAGYELDPNYEGEC